MLAFFSPPVILTVRLLLIQPYACFFFIKEHGTHPKHAPSLYTLFFRLSRKKLKFFLKIQGFFTMTRTSPLSHFCFYIFCPFFRKIRLFHCSFCHVPFPGCTYDPEIRFIHTGFFYLYPSSRFTIRRSIFGKIEITVSILAI